MALNAMGHEVATAADPQEALEKLAEFRPDVMLVDVMMPTGTEGFHLVWKTRRLEDEDLKNVPILMATAIHQEVEMRFYPEETDGTYEAGEFLPVQGWLDKPIGVAELSDKIDALLSKG